MAMTAMRTDLGSLTGTSEELPTTASLLVPAQRTPVLDTQFEAMRAITVLLVDPDRTTRESLRDGLTDVGVGSVVEAASAAVVDEVVAQGKRGDLALVSLANGPYATSMIEQLKAAGWTRVLALAPTADIGPVIDAVGAGVNGVLIGRRANPAAANIPVSIHDLSSREIEVIRLVADGRSNKWIGEQLSLSALTVKSHLARIGRKLGTGDRAHMVALAMRAGVIS